MASQCEGRVSGSQRGYSHRVEEGPALGADQKFEERVAVAVVHLPAGPLHRQPKASERADDPRRLHPEGGQGRRRLLDPALRPAPLPERVELRETALGQGSGGGVGVDALDADERDAPGHGLDAAVGPKHSHHEAAVQRPHRQRCRHRHRRQQHVDVGEPLERSRGWRDLKMRRSEVEAKSVSDFSPS